MVKMFCCMNNLLKTHSANMSIIKCVLHSLRIITQYQPLIYFTNTFTPSFIMHYNKCKSEEQEDQSSKEDNKYQRVDANLLERSSIQTNAADHASCWCTACSLELQTRWNPLWSGADILYAPSRQVFCSVSWFPHAISLSLLSYFLK